MHIASTFMKSAASKNSPPKVGATLQRIRLERGWTLEDLSRAAGVSKSMLSQIEREKANPTVAVAWRLANALGVGIAELLDTEVRLVESIRVLDTHETPTLPGGLAGYVLRILGPMELAGKVEWYERTLGPDGARGSHPQRASPRPWALAHPSRSASPWRSPCRETRW